MMFDQVIVLQNARLWKMLRLLLVWGPNLWPSVQLKLLNFNPNKKKFLTIEITHLFVFFVFFCVCGQACAGACGRVCVVVA